MTATGRTDGLLRELTEAECWQHLAERSIGRIGYVDRGGPVVLPLNYAVRDGRIWVRTASYNQLAIHLPGQLAAFEVDDADEHNHTGWSVLVRGRAEHVTSPEHAGAPDAIPWPDGARSMVFCLTPDEITGRALRQGDVTPGPDHRPGSTQRS